MNLSASYLSYSADLTILFHVSYKPTYAVRLNLDRFESIRYHGLFCCSSIITRLSADLSCSDLMISVRSS